MFEIKKNSLIYSLFFWYRLVMCLDTPKEGDRVSCIMLLSHLIMSIVCVVFALFASVCTLIFVCCGLAPIALAIALGWLAEKACGVFGVFKGTKIGQRLCPDYEIV